MSDNKSKLAKLERHLKELEDRFYAECDFGEENCNCGITEDGPSAEILFELILEHLNLEVEEIKAQWKLKKK